MIAFFITTFVVGLVLGVHVMMHGVERHAGLDAIGRQLAATRRTYTTAALSVFLTVFGIVGYGILRAGSVGAPAAVLLALAGGAAGAVALVALVAKAIVPAAARDVIDDRYLLQGHPGRVESTIPADGRGRIAYVIGEQSYSLEAASLEGELLLENAEVAIERIEDGVAWVEAWARVEQRI
ncbi:MAG TPA: hypothetical protein VFG84_04025 [Gemmatimonadaceae bacterium]|nr:hypothetical protein [Gemmatimonadaceae bacterium]